MPWEQESSFVRKLEFVQAFNAKGANRAELCRIAGISRQSGYAISARFNYLGRVGLTPASPVPLHHPNELSSDVIELVLAYRNASPGTSWAADKILRLWDESICNPPSRASITRILRDYDKSRRHRMLRPFRSRSAPAPATCANDVWAIDGKGLWRGISPLTILDIYSRLLFDAVKTAIDTASVQRITARLFDEYGPPRRMRCDGGAPFGGNGVAQLSRLSVWWMDQGIVVEHVSKPQHNGHLERLHRTLEQEASRTLNVEVALAQFRRTYNELRPHESLGGKTPAEVYTAVPFDPTPDIVARFDDERTVRSNGYFKWGGVEVFLSEALVRRSVTFRLLEQSLWLIRYRNTPLALFDDVAKKLRRCPAEVFERFT